MASSEQILIIPARGGSKRLPRKNVMVLGEMPLLGHVISAAQQADIFAQIIVSTEDVEIATIAREYAVTVHDRSQDLARDRSTVAEVCEAVLADRSAALFCCIYPTAALLRPETIRASLQPFSDGSQLDYVMGVSRYNYPPVQAMQVAEDGYASMMWPEYEKVQSQFHPELCVSNGTLYWVKAEAFRHSRSFYGPYLKPYYVPDDEVCDINTAEDFAVMQRMYESRCLR